MTSRQTLSTLVCLALLTLSPLANAQDGLVFLDLGPRAVGAGGSISWRRGALSFGGSLDAYTPYENPTSTFIEAFALVRWDVPRSAWMVMVYPGVGWTPSSNAWSPRAFLIVTTRERVAPWVNLFVSVPPDNPSDTYSQVRLGVRIGIVGPLALLPYLETPLTPVLRLPFQSSTNQMGLLATLVL